MDRLDAKDPLPTPRRKVLPALTPGLRRTLLVLAVAIAILGANSLYLAAITAIGAWRGANYENQFYMAMFLLHLALGIALILPFLLFAALHVRNTIRRRNRRAVRAGFMLLGACMAVIVTGVVMTLRLLPVDGFGGRLTYWIHVLSPLLAIVFYVMHRLYGPRIRWRWGVAYGLVVGAAVIVMAALHTRDPRRWNVRGGGEEYFHPSETRTVTMGFIPERALMMDSYCMECHPDAVRDHEQSVHHFSSFNNPIYLFSIRETRDVLMKRDGSVKGARFCAGCHDPVPFLSGAFDDPNYDIENAPSAHAGITCTVCHAITDVAGTIGNGNYTIEEPLHYPFAYSENPVLQWINHQLVKAKPAFHKKTFLKPLHKTAEFCAACHKVSIPYELNHYKEWLRGQNHYDNFLLSGVSGHGARSFYYPEHAESNCNECHMPPRPSDDFGNRDGAIHDHRFPGANTAIPHLANLDDQARMQREFLEDGQVRIDVFGIKEDGRIDGELHAPLRPDVIELEPGREYLLEVVVRTLKVGHLFTQGTTDSNEVWVEVTARQGDTIIGKSGAIDERGHVDPWSYFMNSLVLDREGRRIDRRNVQDIFVPLYSHQQPPGTGQVVHYRFRVPPRGVEPVRVEVALRYRKFDQRLMEYVWNDRNQRRGTEEPIPELPIATMAADLVEIPVRGGAPVHNPARGIPASERWRDYGIGLLREGDAGSSKGELRQAARAFEIVAETDPRGWVDLARVYEKEGRLDDARRALERAVSGGVAETWTVNWLSGLIDLQNATTPDRLDRAIRSFESVLSARVPDRGFDFSRDYVVRLELGQALFLRARMAAGEERRRFMQRAVGAFKAVLALDSENLAAHYNLMLCYRQLGNREAAARHQRLHERYKPDDNARDRAVAIHRAENPAANHAAEAIVVYDLQREER